MQRSLVVEMNDSPTTCNAPQQQVASQSAASPRAAIDECTNTRDAHAARRLIAQIHAQLETAANRDTRAASHDELCAHWRLALLRHVLPRHFSALSRDFIATHVDWFFVHPQDNILGVFRAFEAILKEKSGSDASEVATKKSASSAAAGESVVASAATAASSPFMVAIHSRSTAQHHNSLDDIERYLQHWIYDENAFKALCSALGSDKSGSDNGHDGRSGGGSASARHSALLECVTKIPWRLANARDGKVPRNLSADAIVQRLVSALLHVSFAEVANASIGDVDAASTAAAVKIDDHSNYSIILATEYAQLLASVIRRCMKLAPAVTVQSIVDVCVRQSAPRNAEADAVHNDKSSNALLRATCAIIPRTLRLLSMDVLQRISQRLLNAIAPPESLQFVFGDLLYANAAARATAVNDALVELATQILPTNSSLRHAGTLYALVDFLARADEVCENGDESEESASKKNTQTRSLVLQIATHSASMWSDETYLQRVEQSKQHYVCLSLYYALKSLYATEQKHVKKSSIVRNCERLSTRVMDGVQKRLSQPDKPIRLQAMLIAEVFSLFLDRENPLRFEGFAREEVLGTCDFKHVDDAKQHFIEEEVTIRMPVKGSSSGDCRRAQESEQGSVFDDNSMHTQETRKSAIVTVIDDSSSDNEDILISVTENMNSNSPSSTKMTPLTAYDTSFETHPMLLNDEEDEDADARILGTDHQTMKTAAGLTPVSLRECAEGLRDMKNPNRHQLALESITTIGQSGDHDDIDSAMICSQLCAQVLHLSNPFNIENFVQLRRDALCTLGALEPRSVARTLSSQFYASNYDIQQRTTMLDAIIGIANELGTASNERTPDLNPALLQQQQQQHSSNGHSSPLIVEIENDTRSSDSNRTRRWGYAKQRALAKKSQNSSTVVVDSSNARGTTKVAFKDVAADFFFPLLQFIDGRGLNTTSTTGTPSDASSFGGGIQLLRDENSGMLGHAIYALSVVIENAGQACLQMTEMITSLFDFLLSVTTHKAAFVRRSIIIAMLSCNMACGKGGLVKLFGIQSATAVAGDGAAAAPLFRSASLARGIKEYDVRVFDQLTDWVAAIAKSSAAEGEDGESRILAASLLNTLASTIALERQQSAAAAESPAMAAGSGERDNKRRSSNKLIEEI